ncbi:Retrovirus-related Pol polyprotein from transposon opus [Gossypium australe]|uniref:Retrovirus-related Pol polyprotein from transposon opus n=1 Tax=Gossypium australe TaxID=47621 RepID=A0A5B6VMT0_9ROSI|nr:Retrovirus-related Pol polyprotein from transposon opus [Gossypium australe]
MKVPFSMRQIFLFKFLNVNLPHLELINKILKYAKYLKEIMKRHMKMKKAKQIDSNASCSMLIARASTNLTHLSIYQKLRLEELKDTLITLKVLDKSLLHPKGLLKDVLVKIRGFITPVYFVVLDSEKDREIPILLGRPFLATSKSTIDLKRNELIIKIVNKMEVFKCGRDSKVKDCLERNVLIMQEKWINGEILELMELTEWPKKVESNG